MTLAPTVGIVPTRSVRVERPPAVMTEKDARAIVDPPQYGKGELRILTAIAQHAEGVDREQPSVLTGYKRSSRDAYLQRLRAAGQINEQGDRLTATNAGVASLGDSFAPLPTTTSRGQYWLERLPGGERTILEALLRQYPTAIERDAPRIDWPTSSSMMRTCNGCRRGSWWRASAAAWSRRPTGCFEMEKT